MTQQRIVVLKESYEKLLDGVFLSMTAFSMSRAETEYIDSSPQAVFSVDSDKRVWNIILISNELF